MVLHVAKSPFNKDVAHISFPAEAEKVRYDVLAVEEFGGWAPAYVIGGDGAAKIPAGYIERDALFSEEGVQKLNQLPCPMRMPPAIPRSSPNPFQNRARKG